VILLKPSTLNSQLSLMVLLQLLVTEAHVSVHSSHHIPLETPNRVLSGSFLNVDLYRPRGCRKCPIKACRITSTGAGCRSHNSNATAPC
jgi:hypothetical protein